MAEVKRDFTGPKISPPPPPRAASLAPCILVQDQVDNLVPWLSETNGNGNHEQMKVFHGGMAGGSWCRRKAVSTCKKRWGLGEPAVAGARQLAGQKQPFWMSFRARNVPLVG